MFDYSPCEICVHAKHSYFPATREEPEECDYECELSMESCGSNEGCWEFYKKMECENYD